MIPMLTNQMVSLRFSYTHTQDLTQLISPSSWDTFFFFPHNEPQRSKDYIVPGTAGSTNFSFAPNFPCPPSPMGELQRQAQVGGVHSNSLVCVPGLETEFPKCQSLKVVTSKAAPFLSCWERWSLLLWAVNKSAFAPEGDTVSSFQGCFSTNIFESSFK